MKLKHIILIFLSVFSSLSQVKREWVQRYNGTANSFDLASSLSIDGNSNVLVYGTTSTLGSLTDILVCKYNSSGSIIWSTVFNGYGNLVDQVNASALDNFGNSYVTGFTSDTNGVIKIITLKFDTNGSIVWSNIFLPPLYTQGYGKAIAVDNSQNVYTCGYVRKLNGSFDIVTLKYSHTGILVDSIFYTGNALSNEIPVSVCVDNSSCLYVLGTSNQFSNSDEVLIVKYNQQLSPIWSKIISGTSSFSDIAIQMITSHDDRLIICAAMNNISSGFDYGIYKIDTNSALISQYVYNGFGNNQDIPYSIICDTLNNIYVTGSSRNADTLGSEDIVTIKLNQDGNMLWLRQYNGAGNGIDYGTSVTMDASGNVYVGGTSDKNNNHVAYALLKYSSSGGFQWVEEYSRVENSEDFIYKVAVDKSNNVFVTGISFDSLSDYDIATIKYSQPIGINPVSTTMPHKFILKQNYPNPFNPNTIIEFSMPYADFVSLKIYDILGNEIAILVNEKLDPGTYSVEWNASSYCSGLYFYKIASNYFNSSGKMLLIR